MFPPFLSFPAFILYSGSIVMAILMNTDKSKSLVHCVSDGALAGILVSLVAALVVWFRSSPEVDITAVGFGSLRCHVWHDYLHRLLYRLSKNGRYRSA